MKRIIIMGASSGMGLATAEALASRGVQVGIAARHTEPMRALQKKYPGQVHYAAIDVRKPEAVERFYQLIEAVGGMDIYLHVAGIGYENLELDPEKEVDIFNTNVCGFARMISAAYRWMLKRGVRGQIAAITSVAGTNGIGRLSAYSASKAAGQRYLTALEQLANEEKSGITFTDIRPGWVDTPLLEKGRKYPMTMTVDYAVMCIIRAIVKKKRVAVFDGRWNAVVGVWRAIPDAVWTRMPVKISKPNRAVPESKTEIIDSAKEKVESMADFEVATAG